MIGRNHLLATLVFLSALIFALFQRSIISLSSSVIFLFGASIGSLLPDADAESAEIFNPKGRMPKIMKVVFSVAGYATKYLFYKPAVFLLKHTVFPELKKLDRHRGFLHSFIGMVSVVFFWALALAALDDFLSVSAIIPFPVPLNFILFFIGGMLAGYFLHLFQDSLTVSGVPFFAGILRKNYELRGKLLTSSKRTGGFGFWKGDFFAVFSFFVLSAAVVFVSMNFQLGHIVAVAVSGLALIFLIFGRR